MTDLFVSYASRDAGRVLEIVRHLEAAGLTVWRDRTGIPGGQSYGPAIVEGIARCQAVALMCSAASMRSRNVKQEIQLAWAYERPYIPLLLDDTIQRTFPRQVQYWLEGCQWIDILDRPPQAWVPAVLKAVERARTGRDVGEVDPVIRPLTNLASLRRLARFTDEMWPVAAGSIFDSARFAPTRDLGAVQPDVRHQYSLGSRLQLVIESPRQAHLLMLDIGPPPGKIYCLCPSWFAPDTHLAKGRNVLPRHSPHDSFLLTGSPGREHVLAVITDDALGLDWSSNDPAHPARVLTADDVEDLLSRLRRLGGDRWSVLATYFDVVPA